MKKTMEVVIMVLVLTLIGGSAFGQVPPSNYLFQWDDAGEGDIWGNTYKDGTLIQSAPMSGEFYQGGYGLWGGTLTSDVSIRVNIYDPNNGPLSDTWEIIGSPGLEYITTFAFFSDIEGGPPLLPLEGPDVVSMIETGGWQTVGAFDVSNGDHYTWQFRSDVESVPEPTSMLLLGLGLIGLAGIRRRMS